jgi:hypothetical protein
MIRKGTNCQRPGIDWNFHPFLEKRHCMFNPFRKIDVMVLLGLAGLALGTPPAHAQRRAPMFNSMFQTRPSITMPQQTFPMSGMMLLGFRGSPLSFANPYAPLAALQTGQAVANPYLSASVNPYASLYANAYGGSTASYAAGAANGYGNPYSSSYGGQGSYGYDPIGGELHGEADVTNAQAKFQVSQQQAYQQREQDRQARITTRRKHFDEYLYEHSKTPTAEEERQRVQREQASRSRNDPPVTEIYSGKALNDLLVDLRGRPASRAAADPPAYALLADEQELRHINVTTGRGNPGLFKHDGQLKWPVALRGSEYAEARAPLNLLVREGVSQASFNGQVERSMIRLLQAAADRLKRELLGQGRDLTPSDYLEANRFLSNLNDAITALQQPGAGNYFNGKYAIKARTVPELVQFMADQGLQFAPAVPGDETAYQALHQALAAWDRAVQTQTVQR